MKTMARKLIFVLFVVASFSLSRVVSSILEPIPLELLSSPLSPTFNVKDQIEKVQSHLPKLGNIYGKNFSNIEEAIADAEQLFDNQIKIFGFPSVVMGLSHQGKLIYNNSWGYLDLENKVKADIHSHYRLCSISKTFTSALVNHLVDQGLIHLNDPIQRYLKNFPLKTWQGKPVNITVEQLLSHTGGTHITDVIKDFEDITPNGGEMYLARKYQNEPLHSEPGTSFNYSNYGFDLLGAIVETVQQDLYPDVMSSFLTKYGLYKTMPETPGLILPNRARYYRRRDANNPFDLNLIPTSLIDELLIHEGYFASGGLLSTIGDLLKWGQLMLDCFNNRHHKHESLPLKKETIARMWKAHTKDLSPLSGSPNPQYYGYGWFITNVTQESQYQVNIRDYIWHSGGLLGTTTILMINPEKELVGAAMTNIGYAIGLDSFVVYLAENVLPFL